MRRPARECHLAESSSGIRITALNVYPVKSCAGTSLDVAILGRRGIVHDREFMVVDGSDHFITHREQPRLGLVCPRLSDGHLELSAPRMPRLSIAPTDARRREVRIWRDRVQASDQGEPVAEWLSQYLGQRCRLVRLPEDVVRPVDRAFAVHPEDQVGVADGFPLLLISEESLADLNNRLPRPLPMNDSGPTSSSTQMAYHTPRTAGLRFGSAI